MLVIWIALIWSFLGVVFISSMERSTVYNITPGKALFVIFLCGPAMWCYAMYRWFT